VTKITMLLRQTSSATETPLAILQPNHCNMTIIFILILVSLIVALAFLGAFLWAVKSGQYDDDYTPSVRILFDDKQTDNH
jgi:cbb3-type cytochrome oxidase maturation protein